MRRKIDKAPGSEGVSFLEKLPNFSKGEGFEALVRAVRILSEDDLLIEPKEGIREALSVLGQEKKARQKNSLLLEERKKQVTPLVQYYQYVLDQVEKLISELGFDVSIYEYEYEYDEEMSEEDFEEQPKELSERQKRELEGLNIVYDEGDFDALYDDLLGKQTSILQDISALNYIINIDSAIALLATHTQSKYRFGLDHIDDKLR